MYFKLCSLRQYQKTQTQKADGCLVLLQLVLSCVFCKTCVARSWSRSLFEKTATLVNEDSVRMKGCLKHSSFVPSFVKCLCTQLRFWLFYKNTQPVNEDSVRIKDRLRHVFLAQYQKTQTQKADGFLQYFCSQFSLVCCVKPAY